MLKCKVQRIHEKRVIVIYPLFHRVFHAFNCNTGPTWKGIKAHPFHRESLNAASLHNVIAARKNIPSPSVHTRVSLYTFLRHLRNALGNFYSSNRRLHLPPSSPSRILIFRRLSVSINFTASNHRYRSLRDLTFNANCECYAPIRQSARIREYAR